MDTNMTVCVCVCVSVIHVKLVPKHSNQIFTFFQGSNAKHSNQSWNLENIGEICFKFSFFLTLLEV